MLESIRYLRYVLLFCFLFVSTLTVCTLCILVSVSLFRIKAAAIYLTGGDCFPYLFMYFSSVINVFIFFLFWFFILLFNCALDGAH